MAAVAPKPVRTSKDPKDMLSFDLENENARCRPPPPIAQVLILCSSLYWPRLRNLSASSRAFTARLGALPHGLTFVFAAVFRAGCA